MHIHETLLPNELRGTYPARLEEMQMLWVEEQPDMVPIYISATGQMSYLEACVIDAKRRSEEEGEHVVQEMTQEIDMVRSDVREMIRGMNAWHGGSDPLLAGVILSNDLESQDPAISTAPHEPFSFQFKPKKFHLGLSGRLLKNKEGAVFHESLALRSTLYHEFDLARELSPVRIVGIDSRGKEAVLYENDRCIGKTRSFEGRGTRAIYLLHEAQKENWLPSSYSRIEMLPTSGLETCLPEEWIPLEGRYSSAWLVGYDSKDFETFLHEAQTNDHLIWKLALFKVGDPNHFILDAEREFGLRNNVASFPHHRNRSGYYPSKISLSLEGSSLFFGQATAWRALRSLGDSVRDIWMSPLYREDMGYDIVYDVARNITPEKPVVIDSDDDSRLASYQVILRA